MMRESGEVRIGHSRNHNKNVTITDQNGFSVTEQTGENEGIIGIGGSSSRLVEKGNAFLVPIGPDSSR